MKLRASVTAAVLVLSAVIFMAAPIGQAAERVRLVDNLVSQKAQVEITSSTSSSVDMRVDVDAISIKPDAMASAIFRIQLSAARLILPY